MKMMKTTLKKRYDSKNITTIKMMPQIHNDFNKDVMELSALKNRKMSRTYDHLLLLFNQQKDQIDYLQKQTIRLEKDVNRYKAMLKANVVMTSCNVCKKELEV